MSVLVDVVFPQAFNPQPSTSAVAAFAPRELSRPASCGPGWLRPTALCSPFFGHFSCPLVGGWTQKAADSMIELLVDAASLCCAPDRNPQGALSWQLRKPAACDKPTRIVRRAVARGTGPQQHHSERQGSHSKHGSATFSAADRACSRDEINSLCRCSICDEFTTGNCADCSQPFCVRHVYSCEFCKVQLCSSCLQAHEDEGHWDDFLSTGEMARSRPAQPAPI